ncbi:MAG: hypothetical protein Q8R45_00045 [Brevundimonas sp.]|uniref:hypothetical protein n=1 Tax=Brevundimonas sp. TaxID=1871086 RepID=UPI0027370648|nr:hypothetical protein [Brevundimonas sp.]MDP3655346.1 hypothetical protein [Brevundimonas sp.]MDZ4109965.1 hypothetical protein [Brevundimonas sp.]
MRSKHSIVTATVAFSLFVLPAHASTPQEAPFVSDTIRCASLYLLAGSLYGPETPEGEEATARGKEWFNRAKEQNARSDSNLPEDDLRRTEGRIAQYMFSWVFDRGFYKEPLSSPRFIQAVRRDLAACEG